MRVFKTSLGIHFGRRISKMGQQIDFSLMTYCHVLKVRMVLPLGQSFHYDQKADIEE